jgi:hypothetical protein
VPSGRDGQLDDRFSFARPNYMLDFAGIETILKEPFRRIGGKG